MLTASCQYASNSWIMRWCTSGNQIDQAKIIHIAPNQLEIQYEYTLIRISTKSAYIYWRNSWVTKMVHFWQLNGPTIVYGTSDNRLTKFAILWQRVFGAVTGSRDHDAVRRSMNSLNFGQIFGYNNSAFKWSTFLVPCQFSASSMTVPGEFRALPGYYHSANLDPSDHVSQRSARNYAIVPTKFRRESTAIYCATRHDIFLPHFGI